MVGKEIILPCRYGHKNTQECGNYCRDAGGCRRGFYRTAGRLMTRVRIHCFKRDDGERDFGCVDLYGRTSTFLWEQEAAGRFMEHVRR